MKKAIKAFAYEAGAVFLLALVLCAPRALFAAVPRGVTKSEYLDIMAAAVGAYTDEHLAAYLAETEADGVQEHGFPRLAANIGVLLANGRLAEKRDWFRRAMTRCCGDAKKGPMPNSGGGNDFSVKELAIAYDAVKRAGVFDAAVTEAWSNDLAAVDAWVSYTSHPNDGGATPQNWCIFGSASEQTRVALGLGGWASYATRYVGEQRRWLDANGMYRDPDQPIAYDFVTRLQFMHILHFGYSGTDRAALEEKLEAAAEPTLAMLSAAAEIPYGGRSNQFLHNQAIYAAVCEWYAAKRRAVGDASGAMRFRLAARRSVDAIRPWLEADPVRHIKNYYPRSEGVGNAGVGCEQYAYFDKYMVSMGSMAMQAWLFAPEGDGEALAEDPRDAAPGSFATSADFHLVCLRSGEYSAQFDYNCDTHYDSDGLGRIQRRGAPGTICLSVPCALSPNYSNETANARPLAILPAGDGTLEYVASGDDAFGAWANWRFGSKNWRCRLENDGFWTELKGRGDLALSLPAFAFDGETETTVSPEGSQLFVRYKGWTCCYTAADGTIVDTGAVCCNRNGRYRAFEARGNGALHVQVSIIPNEEEETMKTKNWIAAFAAIAFAPMAEATTSTRQLLYYYDFDTVDESGNLVVTGVNKGTGSLEPSVVNMSGQAGAYNVGKQQGGAFGDSSYAIYTGSNYSLWLPGQAADLGCGTTNGFTISMWIKPPADTATQKAWYDFFGFLIGNNRYRLEYSDVANEFRLYGTVNASATSSSRPATVKFTPNEWSHVAIVATPNATNDNGTLTFYFNGNAVSNTVALGKGVLNQIHIGQTVLGGADAPIRSKGWSSTAIDEFALFNYPATSEQVKWLTKHKPGQPTGGPGREMPLSWRFERNNGGIAETWNSGTGDIATQYTKSRATDQPYTMKGALNTVSAYQAYGNGFTFAAMDDEAGLGASAGSGFSFSFWLYGGSAILTSWADFFGFYLGSRNAIHLEWTNRENPYSFCAYGGNPSGEVKEGRLTSTWQHVAISYDAANSAIDVYLDGVKRAVTYLQTPISQTDVVKRITAGPGSYYFENNTLVRRSDNVHTNNTSVDELAFFNYSISPEEIAWLGSNIPKLPPLTATNLARTVSADCAWAGGLASWSVLDGTGADTGRFSIYPSVEDTEVEVAVSIASAATIVNDTFVTPAKLKFTNGTGGAEASATLVSAAGSSTMFAPENLEVGDGVTLTVKPGDVTIADTLTFGEGAKIVFGKPGAGEEKIVKGLSFGSYSLPSGDSDLLSHFGARGSYTVSLSEDGKTVNLNLTNGLVIFVR